MFIKHPLFTKMLALLAVVILLLWGLGRIEDVVRERQGWRWEAARSVAASLAGPQTLMGPLLHSACVETWERTTGAGAERRTTEERREFVLTAVPDQLTMRSTADLQERARGLHKVNAYTLKAQITAEWTSLAALRAQRKVEGSRLQCGAPIVMVAVGDTRGIQSARLQAGGRSLALKPGTFHPVYTRGLHASLDESVREQAGPLTATLDLDLLGTERLAFVPLGGHTEVRLQSPWPHPSFNGRFLPSERTVKADGFTALWRVSSLATTAAQDVQQGRALCAESAAPPLAPDNSAKECADAFSVAFIDPINPYALSDRATKYGLLFIALTFVAVGLFELMQRLRVHPVQYLLVGAALTSFFLLLISLSEHLPFGLAYALAASACVLLLGYYASHILGGVWRGLPLGGLIALLYGLLYLLLQLEQTALVVGALALFAVLAAVMVLTRRVDWYALALPGRGKP